METLKHNELTIIEGFKNFKGFNNFKNNNDDLELKRLLELEDSEELDEEIALLQPTFDELEQLCKSNPPPAYWYNDSIDDEQ